MLESWQTQKLPPEGIARRDHIVWYASYGKVGDPTQPDIRDSEDFDMVLKRIRQRIWKNKLLLLQICFGINETPQTINRPSIKELIPNKAIVQAIPKRAFAEPEDQGDISAKGGKKLRTSATTHLLEAKRLS